MDISKNYDNFNKSFKGKPLVYKGNYYVCPRFWCFITQASMTEADIMKGKCTKDGKPKPGATSYKDYLLDNYTSVINPKEKKYVLEFNNPESIVHINKEKKGEYQHHAAQFLKPLFIKGTKKEVCLPCCFKYKEDYNELSPSSKKGMLRDKCQNIKDTTIKIKDTITKNVTLSTETFPLKPKQFGYLPLNVQNLLQTKNLVCNIKSSKIKTLDSDTNIKDCIVRYGIEQSINQKFIAVLAYAYKEQEHKKDKSKFINPPSISEMKKIIINALTIDKYITYFNGSLIDAFYKPNNIYSFEDKIKDKEITTSNIYDVLYKSVDKSLDKIDENKQTLEYIIDSYDNYKKFLLNNDILIDYTYLWDVVSDKNPKLFSSGLNLIILEITDDDTTDNIGIICPTNSFKSRLFDGTKSTVIIIKQHNIYEPLGLHTNIGSNIVFSDSAASTSKTTNAYIKELFKKIRQIYKKCIPLNSISKKNMLSFKDSKQLTYIIRLLNKYKYTILTQIMNYNGKIIAIKAKKKGVTGIIPCKPSSVENYPYSLMNNNTLWGNYEDTKTFLQKVYKDTHKKIPCKPLYKIINDGRIVGILTETNQFIILKNSEEFVTDELKSYEMPLSVDLDNKLLFSTKVDTERVNMIIKIKLETNFYTIFRNIAKKLLTDYNHLVEREEIQSIINNKYKSYLDKLKEIDIKLRSLLEPHIEFSIVTIKKLLKMDDITMCINNNKEQCESKKNYCITSTDTDYKCKQIIPKKNLITKRDNEEIYYGKLSDEIIRYGKIREYIFKPKEFLILDNINYNLTNNEIILLESLILTTKDDPDNYFTNIKKSELSFNPYTKNMVPMFIEPLTNTPYNNKWSLKDITQMSSETSCVSKKDRELSLKKIMAYFDTSFIQTKYGIQPVCTFNLLIRIINDFHKKKDEITIEAIKQILFNKYIQLSKKYGIDNITKLISLQHKKKKNIEDMILGKYENFQTYITNETYILTNLDIMIIIEEYKLPLVIINVFKGIKECNDTTEMGATHITKIWMNKKYINTFCYFISQNRNSSFNLIHKKDKVKTKKSDIAIFNDIEKFNDKNCNLTQFIENPESLIENKGNFKITKNLGKLKVAKKPTTPLPAKKPTTPLPAKKPTTPLPAKKPTTPLPVEKTKKSAIKKHAIKKKCVEGKILNPNTGRCINKNGLTAKKLGLGKSKKSVTKKNEHENYQKKSN